VVTARVERRLTAIVAADVAGYSRLTGANEEGTLAQLKAHRRALVDPKISEHRGRIVKTTGDGMLVEFASAVDAVRCAVDIQRGMIERNAEVPQEKRIEFRIGINVGDIIIDSGDIFGDGVNVAARLEGIAEPGTTFISGTAYDQVRDKIAHGFDDLGEQSLKNIARPVRVYRVRSDATSGESSAHSAKPALALPDKPSIAVLPFQNMSGDPEQEYFADGMVEEITAAVSRVKSFFVIARNSAFTYKGKAVSVRTIGAELGVRYVLEGSVRKGGNRIRITAQLIDAITDNHIWANHYDGNLEDIFELQDRIAESVVGAIHPTIISAEIEHAKRERPDSADAYDCVLRAFPSVWSLDKTANDQALAQLRRAIELEPGYALALALAAWCEARRAVYNWTNDLAAAKSEGLRLAKLAGDLKSDDPTVLAMLCAAHSVARDFQLASRLIEKALVLDPNSAWAWNRSGWLHAYLSLPDVAIEHFGRAIRLSPLDPMNFNCYIGTGAAHFVAGRYDDAVTWLEKGLLENPSAIWAYRELVPAYAHLGRIAEAQQGLAALLREHPDLTITEVSNALVYASGTLARIVEGLREAGLAE
jgi:adenylate cyclase